MDLDRAAKLSREIKLKEAEVAELTEYIDNLKLKLYQDNGEGDFTVGDPENGYFKVTSYMGKQFNESYLKQNNPQAWDKAAVTKKVVTSASAKETLTDQEYAQGQKPNTKPTVKVELLND